MSDAFKCALDPYRPGGEIAVRQDKLRAVATELGYRWAAWTAEEYVTLCELAGVEPDVSALKTLRELWG